MRFQSLTRGRERLIEARYERCQRVRRRTRASTTLDLRRDLTQRSGAEVSRARLQRVCRHHDGSRIALVGRPLGHHHPIFTLRDEEIDELNEKMRPEPGRETIEVCALDRISGRAIGAAGPAGHCRYQGRSVPYFAGSNVASSSGAFTCTLAYTSCRLGFPSRRPTTSSATQASPCGTYLRNR